MTVRNQIRALVVEDESSMRQLIAGVLRTNGYQVAEAWTLAAARRMMVLMKPDIVLLDLQLEDGEGRELVSECIANDIQVIVVSAREDIVDRILCLELGAEDYVTKPVDMRELMLRVKRVMKNVGTQAALARNGAAASNIVDFGLFKLDMIERRVLKDRKQPETLTKAEFRLLRLFTEMRGKPVDRAVIARNVLGKTWAGNSRAIDVLVSKLRRKIDEPGQFSSIRNVRGEGYIFDLKPSSMPDVEVESTRRDRVEFEAVS